MVPGPCSSLPQPSPIDLVTQSTSSTDFDTPLVPLYFNGAAEAANWTALDERPERIVFVRRRGPEREEGEGGDNSKSKKFKVRAEEAQRAL